MLSIKYFNIFSMILQIKKQLQRAVFWYPSRQ